MSTSGLPLYIWYNSKCSSNCREKEELEKEDAYEESLGNCQMVGRMSKHTECECKNAGHPHGERGWSCIKTTGQTRKKRCRTNKRQWVEKKGKEDQLSAEKNHIKSMHRIILQNLSQSTFSRNMPTREEHCKWLRTQKKQSNWWK